MTGPRNEFGILPNGEYWDEPAINSEDALDEFEQEIEDGNEDWD